MIFYPLFISWKNFVLKSKKCKKFEVQEVAKKCKKYTSFSHAQYKLWRRDIVISCRSKFLAPKTHFLSVISLKWLLAPETLLSFSKNYVLSGQARLCYVVWSTIYNLRRGKRNWSELDWHAIVIWGESSRSKLSPNLSPSLSQIPTGSSTPNLF